MQHARIWLLIAAGAVRRLTISEQANWNNNAARHAPSVGWQIDRLNDYAAGRCVYVCVWVLLQIIMRTGCSQDTRREKWRAPTPLIKAQWPLAERVLYLSPYTLSLRWWFNFICIQIHTLTDLINFRIYIMKPAVSAGAPLEQPCSWADKGSGGARRVINFRSRRTSLMDGLFRMRLAVACCEMICRRE